jgi:hypothetical protein
MKFLMKKQTLPLILTPLLFGLWSLFLGQDRNYDLANYHYYNAFSFLNHKEGIDYYVAELHTFFNPLLDVPYYLLINKFHPSFVAFLMGLLHGMIFIIVYKITQLLLPDVNKKNLASILFFIAIAGCITPQFLSGLGNTMGDNTTALINITALYLIFKNWNVQEDNISFIAAPGLLLGLSTGLKLTNASYALATCLALFFTYNHIDFNRRIKKIFLFSFLVLLGIGITGGFWYLKLWNEFHNPFFPALSHIFPNKYFNYDPFYSGGYLGPKSIIEILLWPFISSVFYLKSNQGLVHQVIWPLLYGALIYIISIKFIFKREINRLNQQQLFLVMFVAFGYFLNFLIFSVQRYHVTVEVLTPLVLFLVFLTLYPLDLAWSKCKKFLFFSAIIILLGGYGTYGHSSIKNPAFYVEMPKKFNAPANTIIFLTENNSPISWMASQFPKEISFYRLNVLPEKESLRNLIRERKDGEKFAVFSSYYNWRIDNVAKWNKILEILNLTNNLSKCEKLETFIKYINFRGLITYTSGRKNACTLSPKVMDLTDPKTINISLIEKANIALKQNQLSLDKSSCKPFKGGIGSQNWRYMWCNVKEN